MKIKPCLVVPAAVHLLISWSVRGLSQYLSVNNGANNFPTATGAPIYEGADLGFNHVGLDQKKSHFYRLVAEDQAGNVSPGATARTSIRGKNLPCLNLLLSEQ